MERSRSYSGNVPSNDSVKIGGLWKRSQCLSRFTRPNYRHRVFILTEQALSYYGGTVDVSAPVHGRRVAALCQVVGSWELILYYITAVDGLRSM